MDNRIFLYRNKKGEVETANREELRVLAASEKIRGDTPIQWEGAQFDIQYKDVDAKYYLIDKGQLKALGSDQELLEFSKKPGFKQEGQIWGKDLPLHGIPFFSLKLLNLDFVPNVAELAKSRLKKPVTVFSGPNNSGKTILLKLIRKELGPNSTYLACNRFYHFDTLNLIGAENWEYKQLQRHESYLNNLSTSQQNFENSDYPLQEGLSRLNDATRDIMWEICSELIGEKFRLEWELPDNKLSKVYVQIGDRNLSMASSGTRLIVLILAALLDKDSKFVFIDEPEIGLSPFIQSALSKYLLDSDLRTKFFPHIEQIFIATHSHFFLDKTDKSNNFVVTKSGNQINAVQITEMQQYHDLHFNMLGNELTSLFLPSAIVIVEGDSDYIFLKKLFELHFPNKGLSVVRSGGDGETEKQLKTLADLFGDLKKSPYRERIFILLDKRHSVRIANFVKQGIPKDHVLELDQNGIEHYFPEKILTDIFLCGKDPYSQLVLSENTVKVNDLEKTKKELATEVIFHLTEKHPINEELELKLFKKLRQLLT